MKRMSEERTKPGRSMVFQTFLKRIKLKHWNPQRKVAVNVFPEKLIQRRQREEILNQVPMKNIVRVFMICQIMRATLLSMNLGLYVGMRRKNRKKQWQMLSRRQTSLSSQENWF
jgi:hypothetical protein